MKRKKRLLYVATLVSTIIYLVWRLFFTLPFGYGWTALIFGILLLIVECMGFIESFYIIKGFSRLKKHEKPHMEPEEYPDVDVFIATYNEPVELLKKTIHGCLRMEYPDTRKVHIYVCDDGNRPAMRKLCKSMNVGYLARPEHKNAKAGNYNYALEHTGSPLIVTFDADMIPIHDFLMELVPYFKTDNVGFVQSPQSFYNADLFQFNLYSEHLVPNEQDYFFRYIQLSRNATNTAIYGGSNTILSRKALKEAGGFSTVSITEDLATGLMIQSLSYQGIAVAEVHASGLSPTEIDSLLKQRERWARGCIQTIKKMKIISNRGLSLQQKINYLMSAMYWYTPLRRAVFILAPVLYAVFGVKVMDVSFNELLLFMLPQLILYHFTLKNMNGRLRNARLTNLYDTILFPYLLPAVIMESFGFQKRSFHVTNKEHSKQKERETKSFARKYSTIFAALLILDIIGIITCVREILFSQHLGILFVLYWLIVNGYHLIMALYFTLGRSSYRESVRVAVKLVMTITTECGSFQAESINVSEGGAAFVLKHVQYIQPNEIFRISFMGEDRKVSFHGLATIRHVEEKEDGYQYALAFVNLSESQKMNLCAILYDRVPNMPQYVDEKSGFFEDMQRNFLVRKQPKLLNNRLLPRIPLHVTCYDEQESKVIIHDFNFEYMVLSVQHDQTEFSIQLKENSSITIPVKRVKESLYQVMNAKKLAMCSEFLELLMEWRKNYQDWQSEQRKERKQKLASNEFDEMPYITTMNETRI